MSQKELQRVTVISRCVQGNLTCARAAELLDLSPRHIKRLKSRYRQGSAAALAHVSRGRPSHRRLPERTRDRILALARTRYAGFNDHHLHDKLVEQEGFSLSRETLRRLLRRQRPRLATQTPPSRSSPAPSALGPRRRTGPARRLPSRLARRSRPSAHRSGHAGRRLRQNPGRPVLPLGNFPRLFPPAAKPVAPLRRPHRLLRRSQRRLHSQRPALVHRRATRRPAPAHSVRSRSGTTRRHLHRRAKLRRPKAASNVSGACCKIASPANFAWPTLAISTSANLVLRRFLADYNRRFARAPREAAKGLAPGSGKSRSHLLLHSPTHRQQRQRRAMGRPAAANSIRSPAASALPEPPCRSIRLSMAGSRSTIAIPG